jgi:hypothetical protein
MQQLGGVAVATFAPAPPISLPGVPDATLSTGLVSSLVALAAGNPGGAWPLDGDLADARNKHVTNRLSELREGLRGPYDWLEVDVRLIDGVPTASHDRSVGPGALRMADWIRIGAASQRGLKLDFKERRAIAPTLDMVASAGVADARLVINVPVLGSRGLSARQLRRIRARFPNATLNLSPDVRRYDAAAIRSLGRLAAEVGGPIAFPLDLALLDERVVRALLRHGRVSVWNDPDRTYVSSRAAVRARLRAWGVDATIDLR